MSKIKFEYKITLGYLLLGILWIILSDKSLSLIIEDANKITEFQTLKGWFYVFFTSLLLFFFIKKHLSKLRNTQNELRKSEEKFKTFVENANDIIYHLSPEGVFTYVSPNWTELLGYQLDETIGVKVEKFAHPDDLQLCIDFLNKVLSTGEKQSGVEYRVRHKNGTWRWHNSNGAPIKDKNGKIVSYIGVGRDITEQKEMLEELNKRETLFNNVLSTIPDLVSIHDKNLNIIYSNWNGFGAVTDDKRKLNTKCYSTYRGYKRICPDCRAKVVLETKKIHNSQALLPDGRWFDIRVFPIVDPAGENDIFVEWVRDISDIKQSEGKLQERNQEYEALNEELKQTNEELFLAKEKAEEANRLKTEFLNNMSHEIRTPMNGIIGFSEMLDKPDISDEKRKYFSKIVQNSSHQLLRIIDDILAISTLETKQEKLNESEFGLNDLLMELFSIINLKSKAQNIPLYLKKALHDEQSYIISDKTKLNKILSNLLENALKFTDEGFIEFGYFLEKSNLILYVKDTGIGISPKNHEIVFERFSQENKEISRKHGGLGLGLSICKENAKLLGGVITLESEKGKGSTFYVSIPYKPVHSENDISLKSIDIITKAHDKYTILVAEDEEVNYLYIEVLFEDEIEGDYKLIHAKNGKEAVEICMTYNNIDLVLMDIKMPIMNGHEATEKIKKKFPNLPIIAQTAYSTDSDKQLALKHGCDDFISKPIDKDKLIGMINKHLIER